MALLPWEEILSSLTSGVLVEQAVVLLGPALMSWLSRLWSALIRFEMRFDSRLIR